MEQKREPRNKPIHVWCIFDKGTKNTQWGKDNLFNKGYLENSISTCKSMKLNSYTRHIQEKINSTCSKNINVKT